MACSLSWPHSQPGCFPLLALAAFHLSLPAWRTISLALQHAHFLDVRRGTGAALGNFRVRQILFHYGSGCGCLCPGPCSSFNGSYHLRLRRCLWSDCCLCAALSECGHVFVLSHPSQLTAERGCICVSCIYCRYRGVR